MTSVLTDNVESSRFEYHIDGQLAAFEDYVLSTGAISVTHTEVLPEFAGKSIARLFVTELLDDLRARGLAVWPDCPYVAGFIRKNPEYLDLVPEDRRAEFDLP